MGDPTFHVCEHGMRVDFDCDKCSNEGFKRMAQKLLRQRDDARAESKSLRDQLEQSQRLSNRLVGAIQWALGETGYFPNLSEKPHYRFRGELRDRAGMEFDREKHRSYPTLPTKSKTDGRGDFEYCDTCGYMTWNGVTCSCALPDKSSDHSWINEGVCCRSHDKRQFPTMIVCRICGDKRCAKAENCGNQCSALPEQDNRQVSEPDPHNSAEESSGEQDIPSSGGLDTQGGDDV